MAGTRGQSPSIISSSAFALALSCSGALADDVRTSDSLARLSADTEAQDEPRPSSRGGNGSSTSSGETTNAIRLKEVVVTGSRLPAAEGQSAQDVRIYDRERIDRSGQTTLPNFLATLPEVSLASVESTFLATSVRLRGALEGTALILVNGRRVAASTGDAAPIGFFDLATIPLSMIDHIEILPSGSSAIYGGEALSGVVNIVLRSNFTGAEANVGYRWADNTHETVYYAGAGWHADAFSASIMASYGDRSALLGKDRAITASADYRPQGGPNLGSPLFGVPANVSSVSGNLPGLSSSFATVPVGSTGIGLKPSDFLATQGMQTTGSFTSYQASIPASHRAGFFASASYRLPIGIEVFGELLFSEYKLNLPNTPPFLQLASVPASNPFNPFGTTVRLTGVVQGAESLAKLSTSDNFVRPVLGARGSFGQWEWEVAAQNSTDKGTTYNYGQPNTAALNATLASSDPRAALNPFVDGPFASADLLGSIYSNATVTSFKGDTTTVDGFARGPLYQLPAGPLDAVFGAEYETSKLVRGFTATRDSRSAFTELRAPLLSGTTERGTRRELLAVQGAVRYDDYSDFGSKTTWQVGVEFRPVQPILLRGTYATAFKPPTLYQLALPPTSNALPVNDPQRNNELVVAQLMQGGNPHLDPATGHSSTLGIVWTPPEVPGLTAALTGWWLHIENGVNLPSASFILANESSFPGRVIRAPAAPGEVGQIIAIDGTYLNFGVMREQGIDANIEWRFRTSLGEFTPAVAGTYMTEFEGSSTPGTPVVNRLSRANSDRIFAPRLKATTSLAWNPGHGFDGWVAGRYIGRYYDYTPTRTIGDIWYLDATLQLNVEQALEKPKGSLAGFKVLVSGTNLTNKLPTFSTYFRGYDPFNYDIVGRTIFVRLQFQS